RLGFTGNQEHLIPLAVFKPQAHWLGSGTRQISDTNLFKLTHLAFMDQGGHIPSPPLTIGLSRFADTLTTLVLSAAGWGYSRGCGYSYQDIEFLIRSLVRRPLPSGVLLERFCLSVAALSPELFDLMAMYLVNLKDLELGYTNLAANKDQLEADNSGILFQTRMEESTLRRLESGRAKPGMRIGEIRISGVVSNDPLVSLPPRSSSGWDGLKTSTRYECLSSVGEASVRAIGVEHIRYHPIGEAVSSAELQTDRSLRSLKLIFSQATILHLNHLAMDGNFESTLPPELCTILGDWIQPYLEAFFDSLGVFPRLKHLDYKTAGDYNYEGFKRFLTQHRSTLVRLRLTGGQKHLIPFTVFNPQATWLGSEFKADSDTVPFKFTHLAFIDHEGYTTPPRLTIGLSRFADTLTTLVLSEIGWGHYGYSYQDIELLIRSLVCRPPRNSVLLERLCLSVAAMSPELFDLMATYLVDLRDLELRYAVLVAYKDQTEADKSGIIFEKRMKEREYSEWGLQSIHIASPHEKECVIYSPAVFNEVQNLKPGRDQLDDPQKIHSHQITAI
ncbi:hypothetical protein BDN72DRAFT_861972, partial [Pluteus cervinus]